MELSTASAIAGSQRYFFESVASRRAEPVTAALPLPPTTCCTGLEVNRSGNWTAPAVFGAPEAMPQMKVPIAGPLRSWVGVAAKSILCGTFDWVGSSTMWAVPVYSVIAVQCPSSMTAVSWLVSNAATPDGMYGMNENSRSSAPTPSGPANPGDQSSFTKLPPYELSSGRYVWTIGLPATPRAVQPYIDGGFVLALAVAAMSSHVFGADGNRSP